MSDTSTPAQRAGFLTSIYGGAGNNTLAADVANCTLVIPEDACAILDLPAGSTFAKAANVLARRAAGTLPVY